MIAPDQVIGNYKVESLIGSGGHADVWKVRHQALRTPAALKILRVSHESLERRLIQEGQIQAGLQHKNVVAVYDTLAMHGTIGLVLEYIDGPSLQRWLETHDVEYKQAEEIFLGILSGVMAAHETGVVHRDLKPANILMAMVDGHPVPKVTDFGLARVLEADNVGSRSGMAMGTLQYMAPEQTTNASKASYPADIFSLGCILYELVTGRRPFPADNIIDYYQRVKSQQWVLPSKKIENLPERFDHAVAACLGFDPSERVKTLRELQGILQGKIRWEGVFPSAISNSLPGHGGVIDTIPVLSKPPISSDYTYNPEYQEHEPPAPKASPPAAPVSPVPAPPVLPPPVLPPSAPAPVAPPAYRTALPILLTCGVIGLISIFFLYPRPEPPAQETPTPGAVTPVLATPAPSVATPTPTTPTPETTPVPSAVTPATPAPGVATPRPQSTPVSQNTPVPQSNTQTPVPATPTPAVTSAPSEKARLIIPDSPFSPRLEANGQVFGAGEIPPGSYTITADFGAGRKQAGNVIVESGQTVTVRCTEGGGRCVAR